MAKRRERCPTLSSRSGCQSVDVKNTISKFFSLLAESVMGFLPLGLEKMLIHEQYDARPRRTSGVIDLAAASVVMGFRWFVLK